MSLTYQAQPVITHPILSRKIRQVVHADSRALPEQAWLQSLGSPAALADFVQSVQHALELQDLELAEQQRLLDLSTKDALQLNQRLLNQEKLASIGTLAAGIAHEINTPTQFVGDNLSFLNDAFRDLLRVVQELLAASPQYRAPAGVMDMEFLQQEIPEALKQSVEGLERVAKIVRSVKEFSHPGATGRLAVDLNHAIQSTLTVCRNEWKYVAETECDLDSNLPLVPCIPGEINQVLLNLVVNAAQAIEDRQKLPGGKDLSGHIVLRTRREEGLVHISVQDNGCGIPDDVAGRIFDPFFTTKEVGRGTGQGLAIARSVIVNKHQGEMSFESVPGAGTTFHLFLPLAGSPT